MAFSGYRSEMVICGYYHADDHRETRQEACGPSDTLGAPQEGAEIRRDPGLDRSSGADRDRGGSDRVGRRGGRKRPGAGAEEVVSRPRPVLLDTSFLIDLDQDTARGELGPARRFL